MPQSRPPRRGYRDRPTRPSVAGHAFVFLLGLALLLVALAGGVVLSWRAGMVSVADIPLLNKDVKQVCGEVQQINSEYLDRVSAAFHLVVEDAAKGDQAGSDQALKDARALVTQWMDKLRASATKTSSAELQRSINELAGKLARVETGDATLDDMNAMVEDTDKGIAAYCG